MSRRRKAWTYTGHTAQPVHNSTPAQLVNNKPWPVVQTCGLPRLELKPASLHSTQPYHPRTGHGKQTRMKGGRERKEQGVKESYVPMPLSRTSPEGLPFSGGSTRTVGIRSLSVPAPAPAHLRCPLESMCHSTVSLCLITSASAFPVPEPLRAFECSCVLPPLHAPLKRKAGNTNVKRGHID